MTFPNLSKIFLSVLVILTASVSVAQIQLGDGTVLSESPLWIVSYIEVDPEAKENVSKLISDLSEISRKETGNIGFIGIQRIGRDNHFAILEIWQDAEAHSAHSKMPHRLEFHNSLRPYLFAPYDERIHLGLNAAAAEAIPTANQSSLFVLTHADLTRNAQFSPCNFGPEVDSPCGNELLSNLASASRTHQGNIRFDILTQIDRTNHMTVLEMWESEQAQTAHQALPDKKAFRFGLSGQHSEIEPGSTDNEVNKMMGSLWDERLYKLIPTR